MDVGGTRKRFIDPIVLEGARLRDEHMAEDECGAKGEGLRIIAKDAAGHWTVTCPQAPTEIPDAPPDGRRRNRVLVLVHGTFSSTYALLGDFVKGAPGAAFLAEAHDCYRSVVGFTHYTLSVEPDANAAVLNQQLLAWLSVLPDWVDGPPAIDLVGHSRGGLVIRSFLEQGQGLPAVVARVRKAVYVATPNAGTNFAVEANYDRLVAKLHRPAEEVAAAVMVDAGERLETDLPGVNCMVPDGEWLTELYRTTPTNKPAHVRYYSVSGRYAPLLTKEDELRDELFGVPNDQTVDTESVTGETVLPAQDNRRVGCRLDLDRILLFAADPADVAGLKAELEQEGKTVAVAIQAGVSHSDYFSTQPCHDFLADVLQMRP
ncbi:MAG TPA: hypothetical protein VGK74_21505 [Symbiobacteriaceae bacterium]|jgi:pimeloyl-ACP methyl ester carboxylesterase